MKAKHSVILLSGLLLLMIGIALADAPNTLSPSCPPLTDEFLQEVLKPTAWAKADWNAKTSRWDIDCTQMDAIANMPSEAYPSNAYNATTNSATTMSNAVPSRGNSRPRGNANYVNTNPYNSAYNGMYNSTNAVWANVAANANRPGRKRRP